MLAELGFFHKNSEKQEKEAGTNFVLFSLSRNMIWRFMRAYLRKLDEILRFLAHGDIQICIT